METDLLIPAHLWVSECLSFEWDKMFNTNHFGKYPRYILLIFFSPPFTVSNLFWNIHERLRFLWSLPLQSVAILTKGPSICPCWWWTHFPVCQRPSPLDPSPTQNIHLERRGKNQPVCYTRDVLPTYIIHDMLLRVLCIYIYICIKWESVIVLCFGKYLPSFHRKPCNGMWKTTFVFSTTNPL